MIEIRDIVFMEMEAVGNLLYRQTTVHIMFLNIFSDLYSQLYRGIDDFDQCACFCHCAGFDQGHHRYQCVPHRIFYAQPDRWYRSGLYLEQPDQLRTEPGR